MATYKRVTKDYNIVVSDGDYNLLTLGTTSANVDANITFTTHTVNVQGNLSIQEGKTFSYNADLAEMYEADGPIESGTVVSFGGSKEITLCNSDSCTRVAGVVSTNPSYLMNSAQTGEHVVAVALIGRVPCRVTGKIRKGDMIVSAGNGHARAETNPKAGTVIGKALADFSGGTGIIEVVIGKI